MTFWLTIAAITLIIAVIAFYPLLRKSSQASVSERDELNKAFYFDRLKEVEREAQAGLIDDTEQTKKELQKSLLDDIPAEQQAVTSSQTSANKPLFVALILAVAGLSVGVYYNVGSWFTSSMVEMSHKKLDYFFERVKNNATDPLSAQELNQFAIALRAELQQKPDDHQNWFMLGQVAMAKDDAQLAFESYEKANKLAPNNLNYQTAFAQLLMISQDDADRERGRELLKAIIRQDHANLDALALLAFDAFEQENYKMAISTWEMMLKLLPEKHARRSTIERSIKMAISMRDAPKNDKESK